MQDDLISRRAALDVWSYCGEITVREAREEIMALPAVDAEPVRYGCEYCSGDSVEYQHTTYAKLYMSNFFDEKRLEVECNLCPPYAECCMKDIPVRSVFKINYCPNCGARLYEYAND